MAMNEEKLAARLSQLVDNAVVARSHVATIGDSSIREAAEQTIDNLIRDELHDCLAPMFRGKKKKSKK
jgi:hypothetical protein